MDYDINKEFKDLEISSSPPFAGLNQFTSGIENRLACVCPLMKVSERRSLYGDCVGLFSEKATQQLKVRGKLSRRLPLLQFAQLGW